MDRLTGLAKRKELSVKTRYSEYPYKMIIKGYWRLLDEHYGSGPDEHRLIAVNHLGRKMLINKPVHHIDENKLNNDPSNLVVMTNSLHCKFPNLKIKPVMSIVDLMCGDVTLNIRFSYQTKKWRACVEGLATGREESNVFSCALTVRGAVDLVCLELSGKEVFINAYYLDGKRMTIDLRKTFVASNV